MGKLRLAFLVFGLAVIHLSYAETISQPYSTAGWGTYANRDQEQNDNSVTRVLSSEETANKNSEQTIKQNPEGVNEEVKQQEMIVSPEFIGAVSHNHNENQDGIMQNEGSDRLITQTYNDLDGYQVHADAYGSTMPGGETSKELEKLISFVSPKADSERIPDITQLRNISIDQLPLALP